MIEKSLLTLVLVSILGITATVSISNSINRIVTLSSSFLMLGIVGAVSAFLNLILEDTTVEYYFGAKYIGLLFRFDELSLLMYSMVSIIGLIVINFSKTYLSGDKRHSDFLNLIGLTVVSVLLLVLSGNLICLWLFWIITSLFLQKLITFYKHRSGAVKASKLKFIVARMSDFSLLIAFVLIFLQFGSTNLEVIFSKISSAQSNGDLFNLNVAAIFIVIAGVIKSVQIPFHGWILNVMEAPTPVSALLHAGLLNAGPFLIIRFSYLIKLSTLAPALLLTIGGLSAIYGTLVFPSQPSIKKSLAYSSIGHMGFSLMICGMGLYSAALLHLVAHSFYKAHSFLSSGSVIDKYRLKMLDGNTIKPAAIGQFIVGVLITSIVFLSVVYLMNQQQVDQFQTIVLTALIIIGVSSFIVKMSTTKNGLENILKSIFAVGILLSSFFLFEGVFYELFIDVIPVASEPSIIVKSISIGLVFIFMTATFSSLLNENFSIVSKWQVYKRNGFYIHLIFDRFLNSFSSSNKILNN